MSLTSCRFLAACAAALAISLVTLGGALHAASISYPNQGPIPPGYTFSGIVESSGTDAVPLYGPPSPFPIGLSFTPNAGFSASSVGGGADLTDGQLNFTVTAAPGAFGIPSIVLNEGGSYSLIGPGTAATQVIAGAILAASVREINGAPVAPIALTPVNASVNYNLAANPGVAQPWNVGLVLNVAGQLAGLGYGPGQLATKVDVVVNNALVAVSQGGQFNSVAQILKSSFDVTITPEPSACLMMGMALCAAVLRRGSRASQ